LPLYTDGALVSDPRPEISWIVVHYQWIPFFEYKPWQYLYKLLPDGTRDTSFDWGSGFDDNITQVAVLPSWKIQVVGYFSLYKWTVAKKVVRLNIDGTIDNSYNLNGSGLWWPVNYYPLLIASDGKVLIMGSDYIYNGETVSGIIRLDVNGQLDTAFNASYIRGGYWYGALEQPDGKLIVFGAPYNTIQGKSYGIARLNTDWSRDNTFNNWWSWVLMNKIRNALYNAVLDSGGNIVIVWAFESYNGIPSPWIARLFADGTLDTSFTSNIGSGFINDIDAEALLLQPDGKILIWGWFSKFNGESANHIIRLHSDWRVDTWFIYGNGFDSVMNKEWLHFLSNWTVEVHSYATQYNGQPLTIMEPWLAYSSRAFLWVAKPVIWFTTTESSYTTGDIMIPFSGSDPRGYTTGILYQLNSTWAEWWFPVSYFENTTWAITWYILLTWLTRWNDTIYIKWVNMSWDVSYPVPYSFFIDIPDTTPPVVTLRWSSQVTISQWDVFIDEWWLRTDNCDGSGVIVSATSGTVSTNTTWTYILEYTYTDKAGHSSTVMRTVIIIPQPFIVTNWWGGLMLDQDNCPYGDYSQSYYDNSCWDHDAATTWIVVSNTALSGTSEELLAYRRALWLHMFSSLDNINGKITRAELARLMTIYAIKELNKNPGKIYWCEKFQDFWSNEEINMYMKLSCHLWIMWLHADGKTPKKKFQPQSYVTRAEFGTAFSRLLYGDTYDNNNGTRYRVNHLNHLKREHILTIIDPKIKESRKRVL
jgi:uncharacterized delta-60 repeat protein